jgi:hypothetical protein
MSLIFLNDVSGCTLVFRTLSTTPSRVIITNTGLKLTPHDHDPDKMSEWRDVPPGCEIPFEFSSREKMRHKVSEWDVSKYNRNTKVQSKVSMRRLTDTEA